MLSLELVGDLFSHRPLEQPLSSSTVRLPVDRLDTVRKKALAGGLTAFRMGIATTAVTVTVFFPYLHF